MDCQAGEAQAHDEPLATMLRIFEPHRGIVANDFLGKRPGHEHAGGWRRDSGPALLEQWAISAAYLPKP
jgi:hypothetical protein